MPPPKSYMSCLNNVYADNSTMHKNSCLIPMPCRGSTDTSIFMSWYATRIKACHPSPQKCVRGKIVLKSFSFYSIISIVQNIGLEMWCVSSYRVVTDVWNFHSTWWNSIKTIIVICQRWGAQQRQDHPPPSPFCFLPYVITVHWVSWVYAVHSSLRQKGEGLGRKVIFPTTASCNRSSTLLSRLNLSVKHPLNMLGSQIWKSLSVWFFPFDAAYDEDGHRLNLDNPWTCPVTLQIADCCRWFVCEWISFQFTSFSIYASRTTNSLDLVVYFLIEQIPFRFSFLHVVIQTLQTKEGKKRSLMTMWSVLLPRKQE